MEMEPFDTETPERIAFRERCKELVELDITDHKNPKIILNKKRKKKSND